MLLVSNFENLRIILFYIQLTEYRDVFRTQTNINDRASLWKCLTAKSRLLFLRKSSILDGWPGSKYASEISV